MQFKVAVFNDRGTRFFAGEFSKWTGQKDA